MIRTAIIGVGNMGSKYASIIQSGAVPEMKLAAITRVRGAYRDLLLRNKQERKTYIVTEPAKGVQEAILTYQVQEQTTELTRVRIQLQTGRTHQIRAQFSGRGTPLVGDRKYSLLEDECEIALWSYRLVFAHPTTGEKLEFILQPPEIYPWTVC